MTYLECVELLEELKDAGFKHYEIAERLGCSASSIGRWLKCLKPIGRVLAPRLRALAEEQRQLKQAVILPLRRSANG